MILNSMGSFNADSNFMLASTKSGGEFLSEVQNADYESELFAASYTNDPRIKTKLDETLNFNNNLSGSSCEHSGSSSNQNTSSNTSGTSTPSDESSGSSTPQNKNDP